MTRNRSCSSRSAAIRRLSVGVAVLMLAGPPSASAQVQDVRVVSDPTGTRLQVDGRDFMVIGMNWDYFPVGENYNYSLWRQPDEVIEAALDREMSLLKSLGVNAIRQYVGVPPRWVAYIYERYGIYTILNHAMGRYGFELDGVWYPSTDYSDPRLRAAIEAEVLAMVDEFRDTPGVLMWLLGNENNYGLVWESAETEALPEGEREAAKARYLYSLFGEVTRAIKDRDARPVAMANGDLQYLDIIAEEVPDLDVFGANVYRGRSFRDLFARVNETLGLPVMLTEFGADAWNAREMREDQVTQARYLLSQWREIYEESAGKGRTGVSIGGLTFQFSDGWWKTGQEFDLDVHNTTASWPNDAYPEDFVEGENNMNEEWWGICAKGPTDPRGLYELYPRAAFYALQEAYTLDPYAPSTDLQTIRLHFGQIEPMAAMLAARGDKASLATDLLSKVRVADLRMEFKTFSTGGTRISTPPSEDPQSQLPSYLGFDHEQSFYADVEVKPADNVTGRLSVNVLGNVAVNPIDEIRYENRGRSRTVVIDDEPAPLEGIERVKVYQGEVKWDDRWFDLHGFYRTGHTHWGYEGDFFGIYRDAYYGENVDIYNGEAPVGVEIGGKKALEGLTLAFGPQLWWGANPALLLKARRPIGPVTATVMYHEEFAQQSSISSSFVVPLPATRRVALGIETELGPFGLQVGGLWSGSTKIGETFQIADETSSGTQVFVDEVKGSDTFAGKAKLTWERGRWHWYGQYVYAGIVADGGPDATLTYTGWTLKDTGQGNGNAVMTGLAVNVGEFQLGPNFLWRKPLVGPIPGDVPAPGRPRNVIDDPFAVRENRETVAAEFVLAHDPTPATWMWAWDNDVREDAPLAWSLGFAYRHHPTTTDAAIGVLADGRTFFAFPGAPPAKDLWEVNGRVVSRLGPDMRLVAHAYGGTGQARGDDPRLVKRFGADARLAWDRFAFATFAKFNDWGPYDYHRDFNLTFPVQLMGDVSVTLGTPRWFSVAQTRFGIRALWRTLDQYSNRYCPGTVANPSGAQVCDETLPGSDGQEWEIRTYLNVAL